MVARVDLRRADKLIAQMTTLGGRATSGRQMIRHAAWLLEQMADEIRSLRAELASSPGHNPTSFRRVRKPADRVINPGS